MAKCRYCKDTIDKDMAFVVMHGKQPWYFCTRACYLKSLPVKSIDEVIWDLFNEILGGDLKHSKWNDSDFSLFLSNKDKEKVKLYLEDKKDWLANTILRKNIDKSNHRMKYLFAVINSHLDEFEIPKKEDNKIKVVDFDDFVFKYKPKKKRKPLAEYEEEVD